MPMKIKAFSSDVSLGEGERAVTARISTVAVDREGDVLVPQGCNAKDFQANPVIFYNHCWQDWMADPEDKLPVGQCVAIKREDDAIVAKMTFAERPANHPAGEEWLPDTLLALYQQKVMRAFSVGFLPVESRAATDNDLIKYGADCRRVFSKWKLLEVSCVPLPCNQEAVAMAVSRGLLTEKRAKSLFGPMAEGIKSEESTAGDGQGENTSGEPPPADAADEENQPPVDDTTVTDPSPKRVVAAIDGLEVTPASELPRVRRIHRHLDDLIPAKIDAPAIVRKLVMAQVAKARGRIYIEA